MKRRLVQALGLLCTIPFTACDGGTQGPAPSSPAEGLGPAEVAAQARLEPDGGIRELGAEVPGTVARVHVLVGDTVPPGALLVAISSAAEDAALRSAAADLELARARHLEARAAMEAKRPRASVAARQLERAEALFSGGGLSEERLDAARAEAAEATLDLERARLEERSALASVAVASAAVEVASAEVARRRVLAPVRGTVLEVGVQEGEVLTGFERIVLVRLAPVGPLRALVEVDELFAERVRPGQEARILDPATGREVATGRVTFVAPLLRRKSLFADVGRELEDRRVREVHVRIHGEPEVLIGARVEARIQVSSGEGRD
jgi:HlyD family secretion protein